MDPSCLSVSLEKGRSGLEAAPQGVRAVFFFRGPPSAVGPRSSSHKGSAAVSATVPGTGGECEGNRERRESAKPCLLDFGTGQAMPEGAAGGYGMQCFIFPTLAEGQACAQGVQTV